MEISFLKEANPCARRSKNQENYLQMSQRQKKIEKKKGLVIINSFFSFMFNPFSIFQP